MERLRSVLTTIGIWSVAMLVMFLFTSATQRHNADDPVGGAALGGYTYPTTLDFGYLVASGDIDGISSILRNGRTVNADSGVLTDVWQGSVDTAIYVPPTTARIHNITSTDPLDVLAAGTFTMADAGTEDEVIVIASKTYTLRDSYSDVDGYVLREVAATDTLDNLINAINLGPGAGTKYALSTTANPAPTSAVAGAGDTMTLYAETAIATTSTVNSGWGAANAVLGTGARVVEVWGLPDWDTAETSELVNMTGITIVATAPYVFINRIEAIQKGATNANAGIIKATAATDGTVSAYIAALQGRTEQAIHGVPSVQELYIYRLYGNTNRAVATVAVDFTLWFNNEPDSQLPSFVNRHTFGVNSTGTSALTINYGIPKQFPGPCIVKLQATASAADSDVSGGFDGILVNK